MQHKIPVFVVIGSNLDDRSFMFDIPLREAKHPALCESFFANYERDPEKSFFSKMGNYPNNKK